MNDNFATIKDTITSSRPKFLESHTWNPTDPLIRQPTITLEVEFDYLATTFDEGRFVSLYAGSLGSPVRVASARVGSRLEHTHNFPHTHQSQGMSDLTNIPATTPGGMDGHQHSIINGNHAHQVFTNSISQAGILTEQTQDLIVSQRCHLTYDYTGTGPNPDADNFGFALFSTATGATAVTDQGFENVRWKMTRWHL